MKNDNSNLSVYETKTRHLECPSSLLWLKRAILLLCVMACVFSANAQSVKDKVAAEPSTKDTISVRQSGDVIFEDYWQMPSFRGGQEALKEYLRANVHYPESLAETCVQGRVVVSFVVEKDGSISEPKVVKSLDPALDAEALRVVSNMPKWIPGKEFGQSIRVKYYIPVSFRLE